MDGQKKKCGRMHVHEQKWTDAPKKIRGRMHVHEQKWTDTKKKCGRGNTQLRQDHDLK